MIEQDADPMRPRPVECALVLFLSIHQIRDKSVNDIKESKILSGNDTRLSPDDEQHIFLDRVVCSDGIKRRYFMVLAWLYLIFEELACRHVGEQIIARNREEETGQLILSLYTPRVLCLLSSFGVALSQYFQCCLPHYLTQVYKLARATNHLMETPIERYILKTYEDMPAN